MLRLPFITVQAASTCFFVVTMLITNFTIHSTRSKHNCINILFRHLHIYIFLSKFRLSQFVKPEVDEHIQSASFLQVCTSLNPASVNISAIYDIFGILFCPIGVTPRRSAIIRINIFPAGISYFDQAKQYQSSLLKITVCSFMDILPT